MKYELRSAERNASDTFDNSDGRFHVTSNLRNLYDGDTGKIEQIEIESLDDLIEIAKRSQCDVVLSVTSNAITIYNGYLE